MSTPTTSVAPAGTRSFLPPRGNARRAALAGLLGSALEYYDLFIYGSAAALVFPALFFPTASTVAATASSLATFGAAYVVRPIGAILWGHLGDRLGRKRILVITLMLMGAATLAIGLLPTYHQIGEAAPVLLVLVRLLQGFSAAGESAGSSTLALEHAPANRRAYLASFTMAGCMAGSVLATLVFIPVSSLPTQQLQAWGWRIPFLLSVVLLVVGFIVRHGVQETPVFETEVKQAALPRVPLVDLFRTQWAGVLRVFFGTFFAMVQTVFLVYGLSFATSSTVGLHSSTILWVQGIATAICAVMTPVWAALSDRIGRRAVWGSSAVLTAVFMFLFFWSISIASVPLIFVFGILMFGIAYAGMNGVWPGFMSEQFTARVRFSGLAIGVNAGLLVAGFAPTISVALAGPHNSWIPVAVFGAVCSLIAGIGMFSARETYHTETLELGLTAPRR